MHADGKRIKILTKLNNYINALQKKQGKMRTRVGHELMRIELVNYHLKVKEKCRWNGKVKKLLQGLSKHLRTLMKMNRVLIFNKTATNQ